VSCLFPELQGPLLPVKKRKKLQRRGKKRKEREKSLKKGKEGERKE